MAFDRLVHPHFHADQRMMQQVAADLIGTIGEIAGGEQQARRADAIGGDDDDPGALELRLAGIAVDEQRAGGAAVAALLDPQHARVGAQLGAGGERLRPDRQRELAHRAARATVTNAATVAARPAIVIFRDHAGFRRPPVPAKLVERLRKAARRPSVKGRYSVGQASRDGMAGSPASPLTPIDRSASS